MEHGARRMEHGAWSTELAARIGTSRKVEVEAALVAIGHTTTAANNSHYYITPLLHDVELKVN